MNLPYRAVEYAPDHWHIIGPDGIPLYDDPFYGKDRPLIFRDGDEVLERVHRMNEKAEHEAHIEAMAEFCHCEPAEARPCDGVLSSGICDRAKEELRYICWDEPGDTDCEEHCP